ncbi:MAG: DUF262 domain-containing protein [Chloroflexi bacterium]|nr:DUF262 domain-containing protein [Chloroflexota bacterium]MCI0644851.1 DUF262 domain-containing protein [Chloroflexota bacterium]MCI0731423.1 DUF262 domain-containing protein [Chloroflexota bacterium]
MSLPFDVAPYTISDFLEWDASRQLILTPKFQRRDVWSPKAKSYLIDTILRELPIPPLFIRVRIDTSLRRAVREVVDGQQRLRTVLGYIHGDFPVMEVHNSRFAGLHYAELPEDIQEQFLGYPFTVNLLRDVSDADVLNIFARMNTYTYPLTAQELRNAEFFGVFKQTIYRLAHQHYAFWLNNNILTNLKIARMADAELVSELVVSMLDGIRQTKSADLRNFYEGYDDSFPQSQRVEEEFGETINIIGNLFPNSLRGTQFSRGPLFYSLFCAVYDAKFGLPNSKQSRLSFSSRQSEVVIRGLNRLDEIVTRILAAAPTARAATIAALIEEKPTQNEYLAFIDATRLSTADVGKRRLRHDFLWNYVLEAAIKA